jgi:hypothetical protein
MGSAAHPVIGHHQTLSFDVILGQGRIGLAPSAQQGPLAWLPVQISFWTP